MASQELFQIVSSGKTLRSLTADRVLKDAAKVFGIQQEKARRLLLKGWVIRDEMTSREVITYQSCLQKIGLRVEVLPAGKYSNEAMLARIRYAQRRKDGASNQGASKVTPQSMRTAEAPSSHPSKLEPKVKPQLAPNTSRKESKLSEKPNKNTGARAQIAALFSKESVPSSNRNFASLLKLFGTMLPASVVPLALSGFLLIAVFNISMASGDIVAATLASGFQFSSLAGFALSLLLSLGIVLFFTLPFLLAAKSNPAGSPGRGRIKELKRSEAQGVFLLVDQLCERLNGPEISMVRVSVGADVSIEGRHLQNVFSKTATLTLGLGAVTTLSGRELMAVTARTLSGNRSRLLRLCQWLVFETDRRLQLIPESLESEAGGYGLNEQAQCLSAKGPLGIFKPIGPLVVPIYERLGRLHRSLSAPAAQQLKEIADCGLARAIGSDAVSVLSLKWQQVLHATLVVNEVEREAALAGQCLANTPLAIRSALLSLDEETRSNIEDSLTVTADIWDREQGIDAQRVAQIEALGYPALLNTDFSVHKLFADLPALAAEVSAPLDASLTPVPNDQLLIDNSGLAEARSVISEYFNSVIPQDYLGLKLPVGEQFEGMGLQETIDWLRGGLVDLSELLVKIEDLESRSAIQLVGRSLVRAHQSVDARTYFLSGDTVIAADASQRDTESRLDGAVQQSEQILSVFAQRIEHAIQALPPTQKMSARSSWERLQAYLPLAARLRKARHFGDALTAALDRGVVNRGATDEGARPVLEKICQMTVKELVAVQSLVERCSLLRSTGLVDKVSSRVGQSKREFSSLPAGRRKATLMITELARRSASLWMAVWNSYEVELGELLQLCLSRERSSQLRPLRLATPVPVQEAS